jgi:hypothetical protein
MCWILASAIDVVRGPAARRARDRSKRNIHAAAVVLLAGISLVGAPLRALHAEPLPPPAGRPAPGPLPPQPSTAAPFGEIRRTSFPFRCVQGGRCINHRYVFQYRNCQRRVIGNIWCPY